MNAPVARMECGEQAPMIDELTKFLDDGSMGGPDEIYRHHGDGDGHRNGRENPCGRVRLLLAPPEPLVSRLLQCRDRACRVAQRCRRIWVGNAGPAFHSDDSVFQVAEFVVVGFLEVVDLIADRLRDLPYVVGELVDLLCEGRFLLLRGEKVSLVLLVKRWRPLLSGKTPETDANFLLSDQGHQAARSNRGHALAAQAAVHAASMTMAANLPVRSLARCVLESPRCIAP
jgi:hypothetical protein